MNKFFIVGPNRCGTTLLARCIDDHPQCLCLWESFAHQIVFGGKRSHDHIKVMKQHGLSESQAKMLSKILRRNSAESLMTWYDRCAEMLMEIYNKPTVTTVGDKNPYFYSSPAIKALKPYPKIWIIRDPRVRYDAGRIQNKH